MPASLSNVAWVGNEPTDGVICSAWADARFAGYTHARPKAGDPYPSGNPDNTEGFTLSGGDNSGAQGQYLLTGLLTGDYWVATQLGSGPDRSNTPGLNIAWTKYTVINPADLP